MYKLSFNELQSIVIKEKWCHELDETHCITTKLTELEQAYKRIAELEALIKVNNSIIKVEPKTEIVSDSEGDEEDEEEITDLGEFADCL